MESLTQSIHYPLQLLIYTSVIFIIITGVFLIQLLFNLIKLSKTMDDFVKATQEELEPAIKEIKNTLVGINQVSSNVSDQINNMNKGLQKGAKSVLQAGAVFGSHAKVIGEVIFKSLKEGLYLLMSNKK